MLELKELTPLKEPGIKRHLIAQELRAEILASRMVPDSPLPSTVALARQFGVAYNTVHFALDDLVREGLLVRHRGKGTFVANSPGRKRPLTGKYGLLLPPKADISAKNYGDRIFDTIDGASAGAETFGGELAVVSLPSSCDEALSLSRRNAIQRYDGILLITRQFSAAITYLREQRIPYAVLFAEKEGTETVVNYDREAAVREGVRHLAGLGYRSIGYFGEMHPVGSKFNFFCKALCDQGLALSMAHCREYVGQLPADVAISEFLSGHSLPRAVLVDNFHSAEILMRAALYRGIRVPEDLAILAYGIEHSLSAGLPLSFVEVPYYEIGREGICLLDKVARGNAVPNSFKLMKARLRIRQSCGATAPNGGTR